MTIPKIVVGEHTITIEKNGEQVTPTLDDLKDMNEDKAPIKNTAVVTAADSYFTGGAIKALEQGEIEGYLVVWGNENQRDKQGEFFTPHTEFRLDYYKERPVLYHHGLAEADSLKIGEIYEVVKDDKGILAKARLFIDAVDEGVRKFAQDAWDKTKQNLLFWSSGSIGHLVDILPTGQITKWPLVEGSLTPTPAEPVRTKVDAIKTAFKQMAEQAPADDPIEPMAKEDKAGTDSPADKKDRKTKPKTRTRGRKSMIDNAMIDALREEGFDAEQILKFIAVTGASEGEAPEAPEPIMADDAGQDEDEEEFPMRQAAGKSNKKSNGNAANNDIKALVSEISSLKGEINKIKTAPPTEQPPAATNGDQRGAPALIKRTKWDRMDWRDMLFVKTILDGANKGRWVPEDPEGFTRAFNRRINDDRDMDWSPGAIKAINAIKADEVNYSTLASYGDEFVPDLWRGQLWEKPRLDNPVFREMQVVEMPSDPYNLPIESTDPTIYSVSETANENQLGINDSNAAIPDTQVGTSNTTLASGKLAARIQISAELVEDSIIPVAQHWRFKAVRAMEDARDFVLLSADATTGSSNINNDGASIGSTHRALYGGGDGLLHLPLVTDTDLKIDQGNLKPTLAKIREARRQLNTEILADFGNLAYFCDPITSVQLASVDELLDKSINGMESTVMTGYVGKIDSIPVYVSSQMSQATETGVVSSTASSNDRGRLLLVHLPSWYVGFRRNVSVNLAFEPAFDAWTLVVSMRMALARRADDVASLLYNIAS